MRYYSPELGRFLTPDPLGAWADPRSFGNTYAFVGNSPSSARDPLGLQGKTVEKVTNDCEWRDLGDTNWVPGSTEKSTATVKSRRHTGAKIQAHIAAITEGYVTFKTELAVTAKANLGFGFVGTEFSAKMAVEWGVKNAVQMGVKIYYDLLRVETVTQHHDPWWHRKAEFCKKVLSTSGQKCPYDSSGLAPMDKQGTTIVSWYASGRTANELFWKDYDETTYSWEVKIEKVPDAPVPAAKDPSLIGPPPPPSTGKSP
jgi:hypothetical protein